MSTSNSTLRWHRRPAQRTKPWLVHINTTTTGGGVAELLEVLTAGLDSDQHDVGWAILEAPPEFFAFTKNLHHLLHGHGERERLLESSASEIYRGATSGPFEHVLNELMPGDTVVLHDAQTLGLVHQTRSKGVRVVWHCHVGSLDDERENKPALWHFFARDLRAVDAVIVARPEYLSGADVDDKTIAISPAIDPRSPKNLALSPGQIDELLAEMGLSEGAEPEVLRTNGVRVWQSAPLPADAIAVVQVSRWDPLKDMIGVLRSIPSLRADVHLILAGPDPEEIPDDPEGLGQFAELIVEFEKLPDAHASRVHILTLSMTDPKKNALWVNALQRRADIVAQKSLEEGFGLTVTEAMFKAKPVVASGVGGISAQIENGITGILVHPRDLGEFAAAINELAAEPGERERLGAAAQGSVTRRYLMPRLIADYRRHAIQAHQDIQAHQERNIRA